MLSFQNLFVYISRETNHNLLDAKWVPRSAKLVTLGRCPDDKGLLEILELNGDNLKTLSTTKYECPLKCGTFRASDIATRHLAIGDFKGKLKLVDLSQPEKPLFNVIAHSNIVNCIDGVGGLGIGSGAPELVTGGADSVVNVWDIRCPNSPVVNVIPDEDSHRPDCWAVAAGNAFDCNERCIAAGFNNGDIKLFDLRTGKIYWETCLPCGVCSLEFDRRNILMNKLVATTLESHVHVFDCRTLDSNKNFAETRVTAHNSTVWSVRHLPQNRDIWMTTGGNGSLMLWKYVYPDKRSIINSQDGLPIGVPGAVTELQSLVVSDQPVLGFDWSIDKLGLGVCTSLDQTVRVIIATQLENC